MENQGRKRTRDDRALVMSVASSSLCTSSLKLGRKEGQEEGRGKGIKKRK